MFCTQLFDHKLTITSQELTKVFKSVTGYWNSLKQEREEQENAASDTAVAHRSDEVPEHTHGSSVSRRVLQPTQAKSASELAHAIWHEHVPKQMARIAQPDTGIAAACRSSSNLDYHVPVRRPDLQQSLAKTSDRSINAASRRPTTQLSRSSIPPASASSQRALNKETVNSVGSAVEPQPLLKLIAISDLRGGSYAKTGDVTVRYCIDCRYACADGESFYEWFTASDRGKGGQIALFEKNRMAEKWWTNDPPRIDFKLKEYEYHIPESLDELQRIEFNIELRSASLTLMTNWPPHDLGGESFRWPGAIRDWLASNNDNPIKQKLGLQAKVTFSKNGDKKQYVPLSLFLPDDSSIPLLKTPLRLVVELQYPAWWKPEPKPLNGSFNITSTRNRLADNVDPRAPKRRKIVADDERRPTLIKLLPRSMQPYVPTSTTHNNTFKLLPARWPLEDEQILVTARKAGSAFPEIQAAHFPKRSVDAVRRKHLSMTVEGKISSSSPTLPPLSPSQPSRSKSTTTTPSNTAQPPNQSLAIESISINSFDMHWTKDEEHLLFKERMLGRSFETIQTLYLPKRTVGALKRRFNDLSKAHEATMTRDQVQDDQGELDGSQGQNEASSEPSEGFRGENEATNDGSKVNDGTEEAADRGPSGPDLQEVPLVGVSWMVQAKHSLTKSSTEGKKSGYECYACGKSFGLFIEMMTHFKDLTDHRNTMFAVRFYSNKMAVQILIRDQTTLEKLALFGLTGDEERAKWKWFLELWNVSNGHPKHFDFTRSNSHGPKKRKEREDVFEDLPLPKKGKVTSAGSGTFFHLRLVQWCLFFLLTTDYNRSYHGFYCLSRNKNTAISVL